MELLAYEGKGGDLVIPTGVARIGSSAFSGCRGLTSIILPEGLTSIGDNAFNGCSGLTSIDLPEGITSIEAQTFNYLGKKLIQNHMLFV